MSSWSKKLTLPRKNTIKISTENQGNHSSVHPLEVAGILAEIELDQVSIISAILHDVIEDTDYSPEAAKKDFGQKIASIIDGVTKLIK